MDRSLDRMSDHLIQPGTTSTQVGEILAGAATWQYYSPRLREGEDEILRDPQRIAENTEILLDLLSEREVDFVLVGAVAMLQYVSGRNTKDIDFIVPQSELRRCPEIIVRHQDETFCRAVFNQSVQVDFLYTKNRLFKEVAESHSQVLQMNGRLVKCATPTGLVMLKLYAMPGLIYQFQEAKIRLYENDIEGLLTCGISDNDVIATLKKHLKPGELLAAKMILQDLRSRMASRQARDRALREGLE